MPSKKALQVVGKATLDAVNTQNGSQGPQWVKNIREKATVEASKKMKVSLNQYIVKIKFSLAKFSVTRTATLYRLGK